MGNNDDVLQKVKELTEKVKRKTMEAACKYLEAERIDNWQYHCKNLMKYCDQIKIK